MKSCHVVVKCDHGLHARVAARVVEVARDHDARVQIECPGCRRANAESILELLQLGAAAGTRVKVTARGPDETTVVAALRDVFQDGGGI